MSKTLYRLPPTTCSYCDEPAVYLLEINTEKKYSLDPICSRCRGMVEEDVPIVESQSNLLVEFHWS